VGEGIEMCETYRGLREETVRERLVIAVVETVI